MMKKKFCILFAGPVGSSNTPIANYLSGKLNLPILASDSLRTEVVEDIGYLDEKIYSQRIDGRLMSILKKGISFIFDASVDRKFQDMRKKLDYHGYYFFTISLDFSKDFLEKLYVSKDYTDYLSLQRTLKDHELFIQKNKKIINLHLRDSQFKDRLILSLDAIKRWLKETHQQT